MKHVCPQCNKPFDAKASRANRALRLLAPLYCGRACAGLARRSVPLGDETRRMLKAAYDLEYRAANRDRIKADKAERFQRTYDPARAAIERKARMPKHVEYCRQPEYRAKKTVYDRQRADAEYAEWAEAWRLLMDLEKEIRSQATAYERRVANGYYTRNAQKRRRELWQHRKSMNSTPAI